MEQPDSEPRFARRLEDWHEDIRFAFSRGELLQAYDLADRALEVFPADVRLRHAAVLALARTGATRQARARYDAFRLGDNIDADPALLLDVAALDARIAKDLALSSRKSHRARNLADAAERYEKLFRRTGDYYPGINAASLRLLAGDVARAEELAREVLARCVAAREASGDSYYLRATEAEANLVLARPDAAVEALQIAARFHGDLSAIATTRRQLRLVCKAQSLADDLLAPLASPSVIHYSGHRLGPRFRPEAEGEVRAKIGALLDHHKVGFGYGSLASGADILFVEELLRRDAEVHLAMPFNAEEFKRISVAPSGEGWLARFDDCWRRKAGVTYATDDEYLGDDSLFGYASRIAMGLALLRANFLDAPVRQMAVWDGGGVAGADPAAGAAADVTFWRSRKLASDIIDPKIPGQRAGGVRAKTKASKANSSGRSIRAILFGDVKGFSTLREAQLRAFAEQVLGRVARVAERHANRILFRNTWGDGIFIITNDVETAAACAVELQEAMASFVPAKYGLPDYLALRLGGHLGPVFRLRDPVLKRWNFIGSHVSRAARIEPVTPEGSIYVTEAFAAVLAASRTIGFSFEYVGQVPAAKHYGIMRMYSLRRTST